MNNSRIEQCFYEQGWSDGEAGIDSREFEYADNGDREAYVRGFSAGVAARYDACALARIDEELEAAITRLKVSA